MAKFAVRIDNPLPGGSLFTSRKRALSYLRSGQAVLTGERSIRFVPCYQRESVVSTQELRRCMAYDEAAATGCATLKMLKALPMVGKIELALTKLS